MPINITSQNYTAGSVFTVIFTMIITGLNISQFPSCLKKVAEGKIAAGRIFKIIDREPKIKNPVNGIIIENFQGLIAFHNVSFSYPKDRTKKILRNISFQINKSKISFVGQSGCGKSTILQLLMRFYDPDEGIITLDGHDLKNIDLNWLLKVIGYVGQEPVLFAATTKENLLIANQNATEEQLQKALKTAEAWDFTNDLQNKLDTYVGLGGGQLSGGQKQRIAIARAILREPKILLLDEATSALDRKNQKLIQNTLNKLSVAKVTISIAHRIKTIMNADEIFVVDKGAIIQHGRFNQLQRFAHFEVQQQKMQNQQQANPQINDGNLNKVQETLKKQLSRQQQKKKEKEQLLQDFKANNTYSRVISYVKGSEGLFVFGLICSAAVGALYPTVTIFISSILQTMLTRNKNLMDEANAKALIFLIFAIFSVIVSIFQTTIFAVIGERVTTKIRSSTFYKLLNLPIPWYEKPKNNVGVLTAKISVDCKQVKQMTTSYFYGIVQHLSCILTAIIIAFIYDWRTALISTVMLPFLLAAGVVRMAFRAGTALKSDETYKASSNLITQSIVNIRTVCSLGFQNITYKKYDQMMKAPKKLAIKNGIISGFFYAIAQAALFILISVVFYIGSLFVKNDGVPIGNMFTGVFATFFAAMTIGNNGHMMPDMVQCKIAAASLFKILDMKDEDQIQIDQKSKMLKTKINKNISFKDIKFKYESRLEYLFDNFNLYIPLGEQVAFVGGSGCGKSSIMSLLLRFYEPESGTILLDGVDIKDYDIHFLRSQFGVVSQEPVLFNASFKQNIKYNKSVANDQQIIEAAKKAHAYNFITNLDVEKKIFTQSMIQDEQKDKRSMKLNQSQGFSRSVGIKGSHISGGQKQRVAIARSILRNPQIYLFDQATSALDSANEKKILECLDELLVNKSSITIAHRFQTIKKAKTIYVFEKGVVVQQGSYEELMQKKSHFFNLEQGHIVN